MRDLRNRTSQVIDAVRAGEPIVLIVHGVAVADIVDSTTTAEVMRPRDQGTKSCPAETSHRIRVSSSGQRNDGRIVAILS